MDLLEQNGVRFITEVKLEEIVEKGVIVIDKAWHRFEIPADALILSFGFKARSAVAAALQDSAPDVYTIGDCRSPNRIKEAVHDGFNIAVEI